MDISTEKLIVKKLILFVIPKRSPKIFYLVTLALIFALSVLILAHYLYTNTNPLTLLSKITNPIVGFPTAQWAQLAMTQFRYFIILFAFSLLPTAAFLSFSSTISATPNILNRLLATFIWVSISMFLYNVVFMGFVVPQIAAIKTLNHLVLFSFAVAVVLIPLLIFNVYVIVVWQVASVNGFAAVRKSYEILKGKTHVAAEFVCCYLAVWESLFGLLVAYGGEYYGVWARILVGGLLVVAMVVANLVGLLAQCVIYHFCKRYHHQEIDQSALYYVIVGEYGVPVTNFIQMEHSENYL